MTASFARDTVAKAGRSDAWIHLPVPKERNDVTYFGPLADMNLPASTDLHHGLVHRSGGQEGT